MKKMWKIFWGLGFILVAVAIVLDALGVFAPFVSAFGEISIWAIIGGALLLCFAISQLILGNIGNFFVPIAVIFMIFEENIAHYFGIGDESGNIINNWLLLLVAVMLGIGFSILFSGIRRRKRRRKSGCEWSYGNGVKIRSSIGSSVRYIDCEGFKYEEIENDLGACTIFFENVDKYESGGVLSVENNLGSTVITVPEEWHVVVRIENNLGGVVTPKDNGNGPVLTITGENNLGSVTVKTAKKDAEADEE
jgi:hypothetical protein